MNGETPAVTAVLGPTNTGKTHLAIERMLGHATGVIGFPLRLLARENYDRICRLRGSAAEVALITGEEKIIPRRPRWYVCTVEAMPVDLRLDFLAIDEIQLCADRERGHIFTDRLMRARGLKETMFLGAETMRPMIRRLAPDARFETRERLSTLSYAGSKKISRLPPRSAVVAFAIDDVYAIAELIRRQRGGAAIVMGALSPRTRNAQVAMFQEGEVDYLVATDAIGMGLNMAIDHVAFASTRKFDGRRRRHLNASELAQIAGRAGRSMNDGTFGVTTWSPGSRRMSSIRNAGCSGAIPTSTSAPSTACLILSPHRRPGRNCAGSTRATTSPPCRYSPGIPTSAALPATRKWCACSGRSARSRISAR